MALQGGWLHRVARRRSGWFLIIKILRRQRFRVAAILMATLGVYASGLSVPIVIQNIIDGITSGQSAAFLCMLGFSQSCFQLQTLFLPTSAGRW